MAKEIADNALDTGTVPDIGLVGTDGFYVEDFAPPGIDPKELSELFSFGRPLVTTKMIRKPTRGRLGMGLRAVAGVIYTTKGDLFVETHGRHYQLIPQEDGTTKRIDCGPSPKVDGTKVTVRLGKEAGDVDLSWADVAVAFAGISYKGKINARPSQMAGALVALK